MPKLDLRKAISTADDIKKLGTILSVWAHPDDETFSCGGIMATAVKNGQTVVCATATRGEAGVQDAARWPTHQLADIREKELVVALKKLGVTIHHWLGYSDGKCSEVDISHAAGQIKDLIAKYRPDTVLSFGPDGITGHNDHCAVSEWVRYATAGTDLVVYQNTITTEEYTTALEQADKKHNIFFNIDKPILRPFAECDIAYALTDDICQKKLASLKAMPSQTESMLQSMPSAVVRQMIAHECFVLAK